MLTVDKEACMKDGNLPKNGNTLVRQQANMQQPNGYGYVHTHRSHRSCLHLLYTHTCITNEKFKPHKHFLLQSLFGGQAMCDNDAFRLLKPFFFQPEPHKYWDCNSGIFHMQSGKEKKSLMKKCSLSVYLDI